MTRLLLVLSAGFGLMLALAPGAAHAKSPGWILTGGELGSRAAFFWGYTEDMHAEVWAISGPPAEAPEGQPGVRYDIFPDWFIDAEAFKTPMVSYYPEAGLLYGHGPENTTERWMRAEGTVKQVLDEAIERATSRLAGTGGSDEDAFWPEAIGSSPLLASFRQRGLDGGTYTFVPSGLRGYGEDALPMVIVEPGEGLSEEFAMVHFAQTLAGEPRRGYPTTSPDYDFRISAPISGGSWGGPIGSYWLPKDGAPGLLVVSGGGGAGPVYETTPGFDAFIAHMIDETGAPKAQDAPSQQGSGQTGASGEHWLGREDSVGDPWVAVAGVAGLLGLVVVWSVVGTMANRR